MAMLTNCQECEKLQKLHADFTNTSTKQLLSNHTLLALRSFEWANHGLTIPSHQMLELCMLMENIFRENIEVLAKQRKVMDRLLEIIHMSIDENKPKFDNLCEIHHLAAISYCQKLFLRVRIHHYIRIENRHLREISVAKKNRKMEKLLHR